MRQVRKLHGIQRRAVAEHPRTRRGIQQLRRRHQDAHRTGTDSTTGRTLQGIHHRRGAHALRSGIQRLSEDSRRTACTCHLHSRHHRETQNPTHHPFKMPDLRLQPHGGGGHRRTSETRGRARRLCLRGRGTQRHCSESGRRYARCTQHLRPDCIVHTGKHHLQQSHRKPEHT